MFECYQSMLKIWVRAVKWTDLKCSYSEILHRDVFPAPSKQHYLLLEKVVIFRSPNSTKCQGHCRVMEHCHAGLPPPSLPGGASLGDAARQSPCINTVLWNNVWESTLLSFLQSSSKLVKNNQSLYPTLASLHSRHTTEQGRNFKDWKIWKKTPKLL